MADLLARLPSDCDARLTALDLAAAHAAQDGAPWAARAIQAKSLEARRELDQRHAMEHRLARRFFERRPWSVGGSRHRGDLGWRGQGHTSPRCAPSRG